MTNKNFTLNAEKREVTGKAVADLRQAGKMPAVLYGHKVENQNLVLNQIEFEKILAEAGESTLIDLKVNEPIKSDKSDHGSRPVKVLIQDVSRDPVSHKIIHTDLYQVNMAEKIKTEVELNFINEAPAIKDLSGVLVKALDKVEVECLPGDLISHIDVDLSTLKTFDDIIRVKDLSTPEKVEVLHDSEGAVALVEEPRKIEEEKPVEEEKPEGEEGGEVEGEVKDGDKKKEGEQVDEKFDGDAEKK